MKNSAIVFICFGVLGELQVACIHAVSILLQYGFFLQFTKMNCRGRETRERAERDYRGRERGARETRERAERDYRGRERGARETRERAERDCRGRERGARERVERE